MNLDTQNLKKEQKKIKRHYEEQKTLEKILNHIKRCNNYNVLYNNPISKMYGFEKLKYNNYYSFNLCKNGGQIRLICSIDIDKNLVKIELISMKHYEELRR